MMFLTPGTSCSAWRGCERRTIAPQVMSTLGRADGAEGGVRRPLDLVLERAGRRRQLDGHRQRRAVDDDVLDHVERDQVAPELGLLDGAHRVDDGVVGEAGHRRSGPFGVGASVGGSDGGRVDIVPRPGAAALAGRASARRSRIPSLATTGRRDESRTDHGRYRSRLASLTLYRRDHILAPSGPRRRPRPRPLAGVPKRTWPTVDVRLVDVVKRYGEAVVVDHINLEVQSGEFFTLLGPSGCGKTTTLRMIGGFEAPTSGLIELKGEDVTWLPPYKRHVNTVFQNYALFPHLTIYENVAFGLRRTKVSDAEIKTRVTDMLKLVELPGYERRKPTQISGGQAQRVALARALINRPSVLLLDEPLGALDLKLRKQMQVELKRIQQEVGITFIFVTHDQEEAMTMSDRIAVMNHGRYEQLGEPASLYERPQTRFVAGLPRRQQPAPDHRRRHGRRLRRRRASPTRPRSASRSR